MAEIRQATVLRVAEPIPGFVLVEARADGTVGALPGQWGAFHTPIPNPQKTGQTLRRAWSFAAVQGDHFGLFVATVGPGSRWLSTLRPGDTVPFTGPWGSRFVLDAGADPVGFYAAGSGISAVATMVDAACAAGRDCRLAWNLPAHAWAERVQGWRAVGVRVDTGPAAMPGGDGRRWWYAGDGPLVDRALEGLDVPPARVERFYTPAPRAAS